MLYLMPSLLADGIAPEGFLLLGGFYFLLPAALVILVEAVVLRAILRLTFRTAIRWSFWTNLLSGLAGIPFLYYFSARFDHYVPSDLNVYFAAYLRFAAIRYLVYLQTCVYDHDFTVFYYRRGANKPPIEVARFSEDDRHGRLSLMTLIALSPSGQKVAFTKPVTATNSAGAEYCAGYTLSVFDADSGKSNDHKGLIDGSDRPMLANFRRCCGIDPVGTSPAPSLGVLRGEGWGEVGEATMSGDANIHSSHL
jgi:hypothetical protein